MKDNTPADEIFQSNSYKIICCPLIITHLAILTLPFSQKWCEDRKYRHKRLCAISPTAELQDMAELPKSASSFRTLQALAEILHTHLGWAHHSFSIQQIFAIQNKQTNKNQNSTKNENALRAYQLNIDQLSISSYPMPLWQIILVHIR